LIQFIQISSIDTLINAELTPLLSILIMWK